MTQHDDPAAHLATMLDGFRIPQCLYVACQLNLAALVPPTGLETDALAQLASVHPDALRRLLRALATVGVFRPTGDDAWLHTPASEALDPEHPAGLHDRAIGLGSLAWASWGDLLSAVQTGKPSFDSVHGAPFFDLLGAQPELAAAFGRTMSSWTRQTARDVISTFDFGAYGHVVDIGGGHGILLDAILAAAPSVKGTLVDRPEVIGTNAPAMGDAQRSRATLSALDAFSDPLPSADAYVLSWILHDWDDQRCVQLLSRCAQANPSADIVVVEMLVDGPGPAATWFDLEMLVQTGGRERTTAEYQSLFRAAGREDAEVLHTPGTHAVLCSRGS
ncbi:MAG: methyltransferase [Nannocystales bacterium]